MPPPLAGIHHVTAIATDPQRNLDFYTRVLGLRLVKLTVNFDDPSTYHLYYGDRTGRPGTILTFFPWPGAPRGRRGTGQATIVSFSVPPGSSGYWSRRLQPHGGAAQEESQRFGRRVLVFTDPDGLLIELVEAEAPGTGEVWEGSDVPKDAAIRGIHGVSLEEDDVPRTAGFLTGQLGFGEPERWRDRTRYRLGADPENAFVYLAGRPKGTPGVVSAGTVHHVAWRTGDDTAQLEWKTALEQAGFDVTPVRDRRYFHSIYFLEPGSVLFEIATDPPGFALDEQLDQLGTRIQLPPWLEPQRSRLEQVLPRLSLPRPVGQTAG